MWNIIIFAPFMAICIVFYAWSCCTDDTVVESPKVIKHFRTHALSELDFDLLLSKRFSFLKHLEKFFDDYRNPLYLKLLLNIEKEFEDQSDIQHACYHVRKNFFPLLTPHTLFEAPKVGGEPIQPYIANLLIAVLGQLNIEYYIPQRVYDQYRNLPPDFPAATGLKFDLNH